MARFESDSLTKKSSKFENFLKKNLDENTYDRVRAYEACIVCSAKEQKAFKYVVLSDECLFLTENPPSTITVAVKLEDLFGIELVDDLPDFLSGQEQRNTTHIQVNYWEEVIKKVKPNSRPSSQNSLHPPDDGSPNGQRRHSDKPLTSDEQRFLSGDYKLSSDEDRDSLTSSMSKSMPDGLLKSMLKTSNGDRSLKSSLKKVTIKDQSRNLPNQYSSNNKRSLPSLPNSNNDYEDGDRQRHQSSSPRYSPSSKLEGSRSDSSLSISSPDQMIELDNKIKKRLTLHLYMLVPDSKMLVLIRSAVNNHLIRSTLTLDTEYATKAMLYPHRTKQTTEKIDTLFSGLTKDLMDPDNNMEQTFELVQELKTATEKYFHLKKLFWKSGDLFSKFVSILKIYLPKSPVNVNSDSGRARRADEFELIILIIQTLSLMFRETEIFPTRLRVLRANSGRLLCDLIEVLTCFPELPNKYKPPTTKASKLLMQTEADKWKCLADAELHDLYVEFTSASTSVLFELLVIAQQSHWGRSETSFFNVCWLMHILEGLNTTEKFLERIIGQAMRYVQPSKRVELTPQEAILVFEEFYIQHAVITYSPPLASFIRNNYTEEFKYYIQGPIICEKLPEYYPISARTILLIEEVMSEVLQKKCKLLPDNRYKQ